MKLTPKKKSDVQFNGDFNLNSKGFITQEVEKEFKERFDKIIEDYKELEEEVKWNRIIYGSKFNFKPIVGNDYHLYKDDDKYILSIIGPNEWNKEYVGTFKLAYNMKWVKKKGTN